MDPLLLDDEIHHDVLTLLGARALQAEDPEAAFLLADRRCRVRPIAGPEHFVLRAEAAWRLGYREIAMASLRGALEIDPQHWEANKRIILWGVNDDDKLQAARALLGFTADYTAGALALQVLAQHPQQIYVSAALRESRISGWAAWQKDTDPVLRLLWEDKSSDIHLQPDPRHPLANITGKAASFRLEWPEGADEVVLETPGLRSFIAGSPLLNCSRQTICPAALVRSENLPLTVIIPVYADFAATKACLESILTPANLSDWIRIVTVDDATPEPAIARMLDVFADRGLITLIRNQRNLGFVGSINRALRQITKGDVILLNADTIVPAKFAARLFAVAHSAPDIATVTPLSNNGEVTSFPVPFEANPLPSRDAIDRLDRTAAKVNAGQLVTIPNGVGFCLYIRRDCLARIGTLSEGVRRGYLEDAEFCLRARQYGFRNVCAPSIYVAHAGGRSFRKEKRALVVSNLKAIDSAFPRYQTECAAFMAIDPLRPARNSIQLRCQVTRRGGKLLICGTGPTQEITWARATALARGGARIVVAELRCNRVSSTITFSEVGENLPQRLEVSTGPRYAQVIRYVGDQAFDRIEFADPAALPVDLARNLIASRIPFDVFVANGGLHCPRKTLSVERNRHCGLPSDPMSCDRCISRWGAPIHPSPNVATWRREWCSILENCHTIWVPDEDASALCARLFPTLRDRVRIVLREPAAAMAWNGRGRRLGMLLLDRSAPDLEFVLSLARAFQRIGSDRELMIMGETFDDLRVLASGNAFVSGPISPGDISSLLSTHDIRGVLVGTGKALFGHPLAAAVGLSGVPMASFYWGCRAVADIRHITLDLLASFEEWALKLERWLSELGHG